VRSAIAVATTLFHLAGGGALYETSPLQRCFRDVHAAGQHIAFSIETSKRLGGALLGQEVERFLDTVAEILHSIWTGEVIVFILPV
jgi:hypothetical protein